MPVLIDARVEGANVMLPVYVTLPLAAVRLSPDICLPSPPTSSHHFLSPRRLFVATGQAN